MRDSPRPLDHARRDPAQCWGASDTYDVFATDRTGRIRAILPSSVAVIGRPYVAILVPSLLPGDEKIVIRNRSRSTTQTLNLNVFARVVGPRVILEGSINDEYAIDVFGQNSPDPAHPSRLVVPELTPCTILAPATFCSRRYLERSTPRTRK